MERLHSVMRSDDDGCVEEPGLCLDHCFPTPAVCTAPVAYEGDPMWPLVY